MLSNSFSRRIVQVWYQYFQTAIVLGQFPGKYISSTCTACSDYTESSGSSTLVVSKFLVFYFYFSQFPTIISSSFFLKLVIFLVIPRVLLHFRRRNPQVVGLPLSNIFQFFGMVYYNRSSLMILVNDAKYIQFLPIFPASSSSFTLYVEAHHTNELNFIYFTKNVGEIILQQQNNWYIIQFKHA